MDTNIFVKQSVLGLGLVIMIKVRTRIIHNTKVQNFPLADNLAEFLW